MALVVLSKVEQRLDPVRAVLAGSSVVEVAAAVGVSRVSVHAWPRRYLTEGRAGLVDRTHRSRSCPHQVSDSVAVLDANAIESMNARYRRTVRVRGHIHRGPLQARSGFGGVFLGWVSLLRGPA